MTDSVTRGRVILHVDMDAFFASVAQLDEPSLRGKAIVVGGHSMRRGVVGSASYEARAFGVRNAMPLHQARQLCPHVIVVPSHMARYREISDQLREVWGRFSPVVEVAGFDEGYLDLTGCEALMGPPLDVGRALQAEVLQATGLHCTVGIGSSKLIAKVASKKHKPFGVGVIPDGEEAAWLAPMSVSDLPGVGPVTTAKLERLGLFKVGDLLRYPEAELARFFGPGAASLLQMARGIDTRPLSPHAPAKSIGAETTFDEDLTDAERLKAVFLDLVQEVAYRARRSHVMARTVAVKLRYDNFETLERERTLLEVTDDDDAIASVALELWRTHAQPGRPLRLVGVRLSNFSTFVQLSCLAEPSADRRALHQALDQLRAKHGMFIVSRATHLAKPPRQRA